MFVSQAVELHTAASAVLPLLLSSGTSGLAASSSTHSVFSMIKHLFIDLDDTLWDTYHKIRVASKSCIIHMPGIDISTRSKLSSVYICLTMKPFGLSIGMGKSISRPLLWSVSEDLSPDISLCLTNKY